MNLTENKYDDENTTITKASNSEIKINPKFYGNQSLDNLIDLKLRTTKEKDTNLSDGKLDKDVLQTKSYNALIEWGRDFCKPAVCIKNPSYEPIKCYEYHNLRNVFLLGFSSGELGFAEIRESRVRFEQSEDEEAVEKRYMKIHRKMIAKDEEIVNISAIDHDLYIMTSQKIYSCIMVSSKAITKPEHKCLYLVLIKAEPNLIKFVKFDLQNPENNNMIDIKRDIHFFELTNSNPDEFFMIDGNVVYQTGFKRLKKTKNFNFFGLGENTEEQGELGLTEFYRGVSILEFIRFSKDESKFFVNEDKSIKLILKETKEVLKIFSQHNYPTVDVLFDANLQNLYSIHMDGEIMIWNVENELHLTTLKGSENQNSYQNFKLRNKDKNLIALHAKGVDFWQLINPDIQFEVKQQCKLARMYFLQDSEHLIMVCDDKYFYLIEVDTFRIIREFHIPQGGYMYNLLPNGDILVAIKNIFYNADEARVKKARLPKTYRNLESVQEIESVKQSVYEEDSDDNIQKDLRKVFAKNKFYGSTLRKKFSKNMFNGSKRRKKSANITSNADIQHYHTESEMVELAMPEDFETNENVMEELTEDERVKLSILQKKKRGVLRIKLDDDERVQQVNKALYKYSIVRIVTEEFRELGQTQAVHTLEELQEKEYSGMFTVFQSDSEIVKFDTVRKEKEKGGNQSFRKNVSTTTSMKFFNENPPKKQLEGDYVVLVGLKNKEIFRITYQTNRIGIPVENSILIEKIFKKLHKFIEKKVSLTHSVGSSLRDTQKLMSVANDDDEIRVPEKRFLINSLKYYDEHEIAFASVVSKNNLNNNFFLSIMAQFKDNDYSEIQLNFNDLVFTNLRESFQIGLMNEPKAKRKSPKYFFFMQSSLLLVTVVFDPSRRNLSILNSFKREYKNNSLIKFSQRRRLFYIPQKNTVAIRDESLKNFLFSVKTEKPVDTLVLLDQQNILIIYDSVNYYELDLEELRFRRVLRNFSGKFDRLKYQMDFTMLNPLIKWTAVFHGGHKPLLKALNVSETISINSFPYESLIKSFNQLNYEYHILTFSEYYFNSIKAYNNKDLFYGAMNPLLFAIYHNDSNLLKDLLNQYTYPSFISNYISPLEFAFALNHRTNIKVLCDNLIKNYGEIHISRADFKILLRTDIISCHQLIANIPRNPKIQIMPKLLYMDSFVQTRFEDYITTLLIHLKNEEKLVDDEDLEELNKEMEKKKVHFSRANTKSESVDASSFRHIKRVEMLTKKEKEIEESTAKFLEIHNDITHFKSEVKVATLPFKYNFQMGTEDSVLFVDEYSNSVSEDFIFSDFKEVINYKWKKIKLPHIIMFFIYLTFVVLFNIFCIFFPDSDVFRWLSIVFIFLLIIFEIIQVVVYSTYKPSLYFFDFYNIVDWLIFILSLIYLFYLYKEPTKDLNKVYNILLLIVIYYRGLTLMRIFNGFTTLIGILNIIFMRLIIFFIVIFYVYFSTAFVVFRLNEGTEKTDILTAIYYQIVLGSVEGDAFEYKYAVIPVVFGSMILTIFLINVLIAYLSNLFSRLEEQQKFQEMKEKADLILDIEIIVRFFKYYISGHISVRREYEIQFYKRMLRDANIKGRITFDEKKKNKILQQILDGEQYLYIIKKVELNQDQDAENVYQKVKSVNKSIINLDSNMSTRFGTTNYLIEKIHQLLRNNSNNQEKIVDELKVLMTSNSQNVYANTEALKLQAEEHEMSLKAINQRAENLEKKLEDVLRILSQFQK